MKPPSEELQDAGCNVDVPADLVDRVRRGGSRRLRRRRRALLVSAALVPVVAVTGMTMVVRGAQDGRPSPVVAPPTTSTVPAQRAQTLSSTRVFTTGRVGIFQRGALLDRAPTRLTISKTVTDDLEQQKATAVLAVLPLADVPPSCVRRATLNLDVTATTGVPAQLGVYPGAATALVENGTPGSGEDDAAFLLDVQPRGLVTLPRPGLTSVDITDLYHLWAAGRPFPSGPTRSPPAHRCCSCCAHQPPTRACGLCC